MSEDNGLMRKLLSRDISFMIQCTCCSDKLGVNGKLTYIEDQVLTRQIKCWFLYCQPHTFE